MIDHSASTQSTERSRAFQIRPTRPPGRIDPGELAERAVGVEPVERLGHGDGVERRRCERQRLGRARDERDPRHDLAQARAHLLDRLDREEVGAGGREERGQLAGPGRQVAAARAGAEREVLGEPRDGVGRVRRAGPVVGTRAGTEAALRDVMDGH